MKNTRISVIAALLLAAPAFIGGAALAGTPGSSNGVTARLTGNTSASYHDPVFGDVTCNETQHPKFDTVSCQIANPNPALAGTHTGAWISDFNGTWGTITYTVTDQGNHYVGKATY